MGISSPKAPTATAAQPVWVRSALAEMDSLEMIGYDPQTSGGLLLAMDRTSAEQLLALLGQHGYQPESRIIGEVRAVDPGLVFLE